MQLANVPLALAIKITMCTQNANDANSACTLSEPITPHYLPNKIE